MQELRVKNTRNGGFGEHQNWLKVHVFFLSNVKSYLRFLWIILSVLQNQVQQFFEVSKFGLLLGYSQF